MICWRIRGMRGGVDVGYCCSVSKSHSLRPHGLQHAGFPALQYLLEFAQTYVHWVDDVIQPCHPLPLVFPSIRVFSSESSLCIRWPKYWTFSFSISPSSEYSGLISFRIDMFDLLVVQGTLKSLLQHHNSNASVLQCLAFFMSSSHNHIWLLEKP